MVSGNDNQDAVLLGNDFWLPKNTARDLEYKMQNLEDYIARYYDNTRSGFHNKRSQNYDSTRSKDFLRL